MKDYISRIFPTRREKEKPVVGIPGVFAFEELFANYSLEPFEYIDVLAVHTGRVALKVIEGEEVLAPAGEWMQIPGTVLYEINRERNPKEITATIDGIVERVHTELDGQFVQAGEKLLTIRHPLKKKEVIEEILKNVLSLFPAPETGRYFFAMDVQSRIDEKAIQGVTVVPGDELFTMSLMKQDTPVYYNGEKGIIHSVYFKAGDSVEQGEPLLGVCVPDKLPLIQKIITRVKADWDRAAE